MRRMMKSVVRSRQNGNQKKEGIENFAKEEKPSTRIVQANIPKGSFQNADAFDSRKAVLRLLKQKAWII
jgi:hypothetical protein